MTIIAGHWTQTGGVIAADRGCSNGGRLVRLFEPKIRSIPRSDGCRILFGSSGASAHSVFWNAIEEAPSEDLIGWLRGTLDAFLADRRERGDGEVIQGSWGIHFDAICIAREGLFLLDGYGVVMPSPRVYTASGSGQDVAMGAMWASLAGLPSEIVTAGVDAANELAEGCGFGSDLIAWEWEAPAQETP